MSVTVLYNQSNGAVMLRATCRSVAPARTDDAPACVDVSLRPAFCNCSYAICISNSVPPAKPTIDKPVRLSSPNAVRTVSAATDIK